jgi:hypothetical protein
MEAIQIKFFRKIVRESPVISLKAPITIFFHFFTRQSCGKFIDEKENFISIQEN